MSNILQIDKENVIVFIDLTWSHHKTLFHKLLPLPVQYILKQALIKCHSDFFTLCYPWWQQDYIATNKLHEVYKTVKKWKKAVTTYCMAIEFLFLHRIDLINYVLTQNACRLSFWYGNCFSTIGHCRGRGFQRLCSSQWRLSFERSCQPEDSKTDCQGCYFESGRVDIHDQ